MTLPKLAAAALFDQRMRLPQPEEAGKQHVDINDRAHAVVGQREPPSPSRGISSSRHRLDAGGSRALSDRQEPVGGLPAPERIREQSVEYL
jgi:hypothetical protein